MEHLNKLRSQFGREVLRYFPIFSTRDALQALENGRISDKEDKLEDEEIKINQEKGEDK